MIYVLVETATGNQRAVAPTAAQLPPTPFGYEVVELPFNAEPSSETHYWDRVAKTYLPLPGAPIGPYSRVKLTPREFLDRLGASIIGAINARLATPPAGPADIAHIAQLMTMKDFLNSTREVDVTHATTIAMASGLLALGYIDQAKYDALLLPATVPQE